MKVCFRIVRLEKRYPLMISRGLSTGSNNLFVSVERNGFVGIGECAPGTGHDDTLATVAETQLAELLQRLPNPCPIQDCWAAAREVNVEAPAIAALDTALWDLLAKESEKPLHEILGLPRRGVPTSVTIGINPPEVIKERVPEILTRTGGKALKIKLGSKGGPEQDKENYEAAREASAPFHVRLRVDANGGWSKRTAKTMMEWLAARGCDYVEQPLARGEEAGLRELFEGRPLPIFVDESVHFAADVPSVAPWVDGVNVKLMKSGGLTEALRIVATARAHGLQTMIGCMGESSVAISAGAAIGALFDHIDLDSNLNLLNDPARGAELSDGVVLPPDRPGHGAELLE